jgi:hypothetical protein
MNITHGWKIWRLRFRLSLKKPHLHVWWHS